MFYYTNNIFVTLQTMITMIIACIKKLIKKIRIVIMNRIHKLIKKMMRWHLIIIIIMINLLVTVYQSQLIKKVSLTTQF